MIYHGIYHVGIYHLRYRMQYIMVYHMVHNIRYLIISVFLLRVLTPVRLFPLSSVPLHSLSCLLASFMHSLSSPLLCFFHSDLVWLTSSLAPHPEVELIESTSVASAQAGISLSSITIAKQMGQGGSWVPTQVAQHQPELHTAQHIANLAQIEALMVGAAGTVKEHGHTISLPLGHKVDWFEGTEINQRQLYVTAFVVKMACWSNSDIEEQLGLCIPQEAIPGEIHVLVEVKLLHWFVIVWSRSHKADTVLYNSFRG